MLLDHHVILITGAAGGLGSIAAQTLAQNGAHIVLLDKNLPKLEVVYDRIVESGGVTPTLYPFDLAGASETQYHELADTLAREYGSLQGLLHSAVEFSAFSPIASHGTKDWGHTLNVNLNAPFLLTRVLLPVMLQSEHASIVFTSDSHILQSPAYSGAYGIGKIAMQSMATVLANEFEQGGKIRINTLVPGPVDSPLRKRAFPAEDKSRLPAMESLAALYLYLFSNQSLGVTRQTIDAQTFKS